VQKRRGRLRPPGEQALRAFQVLRGPQLIVDDAVHIAVVLAEVTGEILQVPEEVGAAVVPAEPPRAAPSSISFRLAERQEIGEAAARDRCSSCRCPRFRCPHVSACP